MNYNQVWNAYQKILKRNEVLEKRIKSLTSEKGKQPKQKVKGDSYGFSDK